MPKFAVKIGELHLTSDEPITSEDRERVKAEFEKHMCDFGNVLMKSRDGTTDVTVRFD